YNFRLTKKKASLICPRINRRGRFRRRDKMLQARGPEELGAMRGLAFRSPDEMSRGLRSDPHQEFELEPDEAAEANPDGLPEEGALWLNDGKRGFDEDEEDEEEEKEKDDLDEEENEFAEEDEPDEDFEEEDDDDDDDDDVDLDEDDDDE